MGQKAWIPVACVACVMLAACRVSTPGRAETDVAQWTKKHITVQGKDNRNPLPDSAQTLNDGKEAFGHYCIACHGLDGQNTGVPFAATMSPPVPSLASPAVQSYTDGQLKWIIENGLFPSGMPASKNILTDEEIWSAVLYIRHLPAAGSQGEPSIFSGDDGIKSGQAVAGRR